MIFFIGLLLISYLIGSIPTSIITAKQLKGIDIRQHGSGNAGGTNAFRVLGWKAGLFVTLFDIGKGVFPVTVIALYFSPHIDFINFMGVQLCAGTATILGHVYTVFANFKGGKGVSTAAGVAIGIAPISLFFVFIIFLVTLLVTKFVSVASMVSAISLPIIVAIRKYLLNDGADETRMQIGNIELIDSTHLFILFFGILISIAIVYTHRTNLQRLRQGTENRVTFLDKK